MDLYEKAVITKLARGDQSARTEAVSIFRRHLLNKRKVHGNPYMEFMSEIDNPCPCWVLKSQARKKILEAEESK